MARRSLLFAFSAAGLAVLLATANVQAGTIAPRNLRLTTSSINFGNVLKGADVSGDFVATTSNRNPTDLNTTSVNVGPLTFGALTVDQTLISGAGLGVDLPASGTLDTYGTFRNVSGVLPVAGLPGDTHTYRGLSVRYSAVVGITSVPRNSAYSPVFSAFVDAGATTGNLSSEVNPKGTLASDQTPASTIVERNSRGLGSKLAGLYGTVGSEAVIYDSTPFAGSTTVGMQWRARTPYEAGKIGAAVGTGGKLFKDGDWLTSDVVKITGIGADVTYALQMSFDNRINLANDGATGTIASEFNSLAIAELDGAGNWKRATDLDAKGAHAMQGQHGSLADFVATEEAAGYTLADLQGSWGVDDNPADVTATGRAESWAIVAGGGSGTFAVLPEPSSIVLVLMSAATGLAYSIRRRLQK